MAKQIDTYPNYFCKSGCPFAMFDVTTTTLYAEDKDYATINEFFCRSEKVCEMWNQEIERIKQNV